jgi:hypothetical protein
MSVEPSQERPERERTGAATAAEVDHGPDIQGGSREEPLAANGPPAPLPATPDELVALLSWIRTPDWSTSQTYLEAHPELLTEAAAQVLATLAHQRPDQQVRELLLLHRQLLQGASQQGIEAAYQALVQPAEQNAGAATAAEDLQAQVMAWLQTPDWQTSQTYLQRHPQLLGAAADQVLEALKRSQGEGEAQAMLSLHQALLQEARAEGIEAAYGRVLVPEPETPLREQDVAAPQALQDPATLNEAAMAALQRYWTSGQLADLNRALDLLHQALKLTPSDSPNRPALLNNLGIGLSDRYARSGDLADLEAVITAFQQAVQATPPDSPERPGYLNNLSNGLRNRYARSGDLADLEAAITARQQAVQDISPGSPNQPLLLSNLGNGLHERYTRTGDLADLEAAITAFQQAVQTIPPGSPRRSVPLSNLVQVQETFCARWSATGQPK